MREQTENHIFADIFHYKNNQDKSVWVKIPHPPPFFFLNVKAQFYEMILKDNMEGKETLGSWIEID